MATPSQTDGMPVVRQLEDFDKQSGNLLERVIFNNRLPIIIFCILLTAFLGFNALKLPINASFERMIPHGHPYIQNYLEMSDELRGLGDSVRIAVHSKSGDIYDPEYLERLREINDRIFLLDGVDRSFMRSLWTPLVRWTEISEYGFVGGPVMPDDYDGSAESLKQLRYNVMRSGIVGSLVSADERSSLIVVPLLSTDPHTGEPMDYAAFSHALEKEIRSLEDDSVSIHIIGFAKLVGDLIDGLAEVALFFLMAALITVAIIFLYTRCAKSTLLVLLCSMVAVSWQLGSMQLLGFVADPYSILVPFLVFAIGVSHGVQKMNGIMEDIGRGTHRYVAARYTFRRLFAAGLTALLADAVGFAVLAMIDIPVIRDMVITLSIGIVILVFTNLVLLPVMLSYSGVSKHGAERALAGSASRHPVFQMLEKFTERKPAALAIVFFAGLFVVALLIRSDIKIGDLDAGAPELRTESRYNKDNAFITENFGLSSDLFVIMMRSKDGGMGSYQTLMEQDRLEEALRATPGVQTTVAAASLIRRITPGYFEGNLKWASINRDPAVISDTLNQIGVSNPELVTEDRSSGALIAFLTDHKADTLSRVVEVTEEFAQTHNRDEVEFLLAAGSSGIDAATNIVVEKANYWMLFMVYIAVGLLCLINFRSWRAVVVALVPLIITSMLCEALMVVLGIGIKVATLPVIALGVGIGVDYALYLLSIQLANQRNGDSLAVAYGKALRFTGKIVGLIGLTLAAGVCTWVFSPIKFQADMGILLTFMFLWNMIGALILIPALSRFLLHKPGQL